MPVAGQLHRGRLILDVEIAAERRQGVANADPHVAMLALLLVALHQGSETLPVFLRCAPARTGPRRGLRADAAAITPEKPLRGCAHEGPVLGELKAENETVVR